MLALYAALLLQGGQISSSEAWKAEESFRYYDKARGIDETNRFRMLFSIGGQKDGLWQVKLKRALIETVINGDSVPPAKGQGFEEFLEQWSPVGMLLDLTPSEDNARMRAERLLRFRLPENQGASWKAEVKTTTDSESLTGRATFTKVGSDDPGLIIYRMKYFEEGPKTPMEADGTLQFSVKTKRLISADVNAAHLPLPGGTESVSAIITYRETK